MCVYSEIRPVVFHKDKSWENKERIANLNISRPLLDCTSVNYLCIFGEMYSYLTSLSAYEDNKNKVESHAVIK